MVFLGFAKVIKHIRVGQHPRCDALSIRHKTPGPLQFVIRRVFGRVNVELFAFIFLFVLFQKVPQVNCFSWQIVLEQLLKVNVVCRFSLVPNFELVIVKCLRMAAEVTSFRSLIGSSVGPSADLARFCCGQRLSNVALLLQLGLLRGQSFHGARYALVGLETLIDVVRRDYIFDFVYDRAVLLVVGLLRVHDSRRHKNFLTLLCYFFLFLVAILVAFALLHVSEKVFDGNALVAGQRVLAKHLNVSLTLVRKEMLFVDRVKLVTEHVKVIQTQVGNVEFGFRRS